MSLGECIALHTHREYLTWQVWLDEGWNNPSRTDQYLMQVAREVRCVLNKKPGQIKLGHFKLEFGSTASSKPGMTKEQATVASKARWFGMLGLLNRKKRSDGR